MIGLANLVIVDILGLQSIPFSLFLEARNKNSFALYKLTFFD